MWHKTVEILAVDVPAIFSDKFQQFKGFDLIVPQIQFILRVQDILVVQQRRVPQCKLQKTQRFHGGTVLGGY